MLVRDVAAALSAQVVGDGSLNIERVVHPSAAERPSDLAVAMSGDAFAALTTSKAQVALVAGGQTKPNDRLKAVIVTGQGRVALAKLTAMFDAGPVHAAGVHPSAVVASDAVIGEGASIGPFVSVGPRSRIGAGTVVLANVSIGADVTIGANGLIYSGVRIGDRVSVGDRVILHFNATIGSDGFSFVPATGGGKGAKPVRIHSLGAVAIGDDVEIGAGTTVDRATLETTRIGNGTKIDNQVQIAHNVRIGESCLICGSGAIAGSVAIGDRVLLGGGVGVADHVTIKDDAVVAAGSGVGTNVEAGARVSGYPAMPHDRTVEIYAFLTRHKRFLRDLDEVKTRVAAIDNSVQVKK
jgi:UDP-3-O-[3-hydroxymyristoyl] glucosamine N-acyltransferase